MEAWDPGGRVLSVLLVLLGCYCPRRRSVWRGDEVDDGRLQSRDVVQKQGLKEQYP